MNGAAFSHRAHANTRIIDTGAADQVAFAGVDEVDITLKITHDDAAIGKGGGGEPAIFQVIVTPDLLAAVGVQGNDVAVVADHK